MRKVFVAVISVILIWSITTYIFRPAEYLFPGPGSVFNFFIANYQLLFYHTLYTLSEVLIGFLIANALGLCVAIVAILCPRTERSLMSLSVALKTIPIIAIAPLLILWFGPGIWSKVAAVVTTCFMPVLVNILGGAKAVSRKLKDIITLYQPSKIQKLRFFILPSLLPYLISAFKISSSLAVVGALVSEFISANKGLGYLIISNYYSMNIAGVFSSIIIASVIGIVMYYSFDYCERKYIKW